MENTYQKLNNINDELDFIVPYMIEEHQRINKEIENVKKQVVLVMDSLDRILNITTKIKKEFIK